MSAEWDDLARLAAAATPGPWEAVKARGSDDHMINARSEYGHIWIANTAIPDDPAADAEFIAAANPATILRLIEQVRKADAYRALYVHTVGEWNGVAAEFRELTAERDSLAARLAAVEALVAEWERVQKQNRKALGELARGTSHLLLDTPDPADFRAALAAPTNTTKEQA